MTSTEPAMMLSTPGRSLVPSEISPEGATAFAAVLSRGISPEFNAMGSSPGESQVANAS